MTNSIIPSFLNDVPVSAIHHKTNTFRLPGKTRKQHPLPSPLHPTRQQRKQLTFIVKMINITRSVKLRNKIPVSTGQKSLLYLNSPPSASHDHRCDIYHCISSQHFIILLFAYQKTGSVPNKAKANLGAVPDSQQIIFKKITGYGIKGNRSHYSS